MHIYKFKWKHLICTYVSLKKKKKQQQKKKKKKKKMPITTAADNIFEYFCFIIIIFEKNHDTSCESSVWQAIQMKC